jgi:hypothetical protein
LNGHLFMHGDDCVAGVRCQSSGVRSLMAHLMRARRQATRFDDVIGERLSIRRQ